MLILLPIHYILKSLFVSKKDYDIMSFTHGND